MQKVLKGIVSVIILFFGVYVIYRNLNLRKIPSVDLIKDEQTSSLYHRMLPNTANKEWLNYYYSHRSLTKDEVDEDLKYNIAYKNTGASESTLKEEKLRTSFEKVFGPNTYKRVDSFIGGCNTYRYDSKVKSYIKMTSEVCKMSDIYILSKIIDAKIVKEKMEITVAIAYMDKTQKIIYRDCNKRMDQCSSILKQNVVAYDEANLDAKKDKLQTYKFIYTSIHDEYYFESVKKLK